jgi:hypothetical protein
MRHLDVCASVTSVGYLAVVFVRGQGVQPLKVQPWRRDRASRRVHGSMTFSKSACRIALIPCHLRVPGANTDTIVPRIPLLLQR